MSKVVAVLAVFAAFAVIYVVAKPAGSFTVEFIRPTSNQTCSPGERFNPKIDGTDRNRTCVTCLCITANFSRCVPNRINCVEPAANATTSTTPMPAVADELPSTDKP